jgi:hypothetical protein
LCQHEHLTATEPRRQGCLPPAPLLKCSAVPRSKCLACTWAIGVVPGVPQPARLCQTIAETKFFSDWQDRTMNETIASACCPHRLQGSRGLVACRSDTPSVPPSPAERFLPGCTLSTIATSTKLISKADAPTTRQWTGKLVSPQPQSSDSA